MKVFMYDNEGVCVWILMILILIVTLLNIPAFFMLLKTEYFFNLTLLGNLLGLQLYLG